MCEFATASSSWPSRAAFFTDSMAMKPLAPGLFSTTTCRPHCFDSFSAIRRMKIDGATPGECGMVILTVRVGKTCASSAGAAAPRVKKRLNANQKRDREPPQERCEAQPARTAMLLAGEDIVELSAHAIWQ